MTDGKKEYQPTPDSATIWRNRRKEDPRHADWDGHGEFEGRMFWVSMYEKTDKKGEKYFFLKLKVRQPYLRTPRPYGERRRPPSNAPGEPTRTAEHDFGAAPPRQEPERVPTDEPGDGPPF